MLQNHHKVVVYMWEIFKSTTKARGNMPNEGFYNGCCKVQ